MGKDNRKWKVVGEKKRVSSESDGWFGLIILLCMVIFWWGPKAIFYLIYYGAIVIWTLLDAMNFAYHIRRFKNKLKWENGSWFAMASEKVLWLIISLIPDIAIMGGVFWMGSVEGMGEIGMLICAGVIVATPIIHITWSAIWMGGASKKFKQNNA